MRVPPPQLPRGNVPQENGSPGAVLSRVLWMEEFNQGPGLPGSPECGRRAGPPALGGKWDQLIPKMVSLLLFPQASGEGEIPGDFISGEWQPSPLTPLPPDCPRPRARGPERTLTWTLYQLGAKCP